MLANATDGSSLNSSGLLLANISIPANHYQCGLFVFDAMYRSLVVNYTVGSVELVGYKQRVWHGWQCGCGLHHTNSSRSAAVMALLPAEKYAFMECVRHVPNNPFPLPSPPLPMQHSNHRCGLYPDQRGQYDHPQDCWHPSSADIALWACVQLCEGCHE